MGVSVTPPGDFPPSALIRLHFPTSCLKNTGFIEQGCGDVGKWRTHHAGGPQGLLGLQTEARWRFSIVSSPYPRQPGREGARRYARREGHLLMFLTVFGWDIKIGYRERGVCRGEGVYVCAHVCMYVHVCIHVCVCTCVHVVLCRSMELREDRVTAFYPFCFIFQWPPCVKGEIC